jgi:hypothetical protein
MFGFYIMRKIGRDCLYVTHEKKKNEYISKGGGDIKTPSKVLKTFFFFFTLTLSQRLDSHHYMNTCCNVCDVLVTGFYLGAVR